MGNKKKKKKEQTPKKDDETIQKGPEIPRTPPTKTIEKRDPRRIKEVALKWDSFEEERKSKKAKQQEFKEQQQKLMENFEDELRKVSADQSDYWKEVSKEGITMDEIMQARNMNQEEESDSDTE